MDQQEGEYETELQQLITAAESELNTERENIGKLRATLQVTREQELLVRVKGFFACDCAPAQTAGRKNIKYAMNVLLRRFYRICLKIYEHDVMQ